VSAEPLSENREYNIDATPGRKKKEGVREEIDAAKCASE
jgi:hypothetical protein